MKFRTLLLIAVFITGSFIKAQEPATIKIKKESDLAKAVFDNVNLKLMAVDRFGNPKTNKINTYKLYVKNKKETREFEGFGNNLTPEIFNYLKKQKKAVKLFFTGIKATDDNGHLVDLPDVIDNWFPQCGKCD